jgi:hypothetical protein
MSLLTDEANVEQNAQVLRNRWAAHLEIRRDRVHWAVAVGEQVEHAPARRVTDRSKNAWVSQHHRADNA